MTRGTLVACLAVLATGCGSAWVERVSEHGRFRVELPEPVTDVNQRIVTPQRELLLEGYGATAYRWPQRLFGRGGAVPLDSVSFMVRCADVSTMDAAERGRLVDQIATVISEERQKQHRRKVVSLGVIDTAGCAGVETETAARYSVTRERVCVTSARVCLLTVMASRSRVRGAEADRFLGSFKPW